MVLQARREALKSPAGIVHTTYNVAHDMKELVSTCDLFACFLDHSETLFSGARCGCE